MDTVIFTSVLAHQKTKNTRQKSSFFSNKTIFITPKKGIAAFIFNRCNKGIVPVIRHFPILRPDANGRMLSYTVPVNSSFNITD